MLPNRDLVGSTLAGLLATLSAGVATAEVSVRVVDDDCASALISVIIEDADPVGWSVWSSPKQYAETTTVINPTGEIRGDLFPDVIFDPDACVVQLTWPYRVGPDYTDVAFMEVTNGVIGPYVFLTSDTQVESDPRVFTATDGSARVVWWVAGTPDAVYLAARPGDASQWEPNLRVTPETEGGRRPSAAIFDGTTYVAYERPVGSVTELVVAPMSPDGTFAGELVATAGELPLDPVLHVDDGAMWLDWRQDLDTVGYAVFVDGVWSDPFQIPRPGGSWLEMEAARKTVRRTVLQGD